MRMPLAAVIGPFMSLLLSPQPVLCMVSEAKEAVDHTTWETLVAVGFLQHCAKVMISNFPEIRQNSRISRANIDKISVHLLFYCRRNFAQ